MILVTLFEEFVVGAVSSRVATSLKNWSKIK